MFYFAKFELSDKNETFHYRMKYVFYIANNFYFYF
jgi:hypothetical protein